MIRRAKLYARISEGEGRYSRVAVAYNRNGRPLEPKPKQGHVTTYQIRVGGKFMDAGGDFSNAITRLRQELARVGEGVTREEATKLSGVVPIDAPREAGRVRLVDAVNEYNSELRTLTKGKYTILMYKNALDGFIQSSTKTYLDEIGRKDILRYIGWMKENLKSRVPGGEFRTYKNRLGYLGTFLGKYGIQLKKESRRQATTDPGLISRDDIPKPLKRKPKKYDRETIDLLLSKADADEKDYLEFLLWSGFRDEEVQFLQYSDFDWKNSSVTNHAKPQFGWKPKDSEERTVRLPSEISKRLKARMNRPQQYRDGVRKPKNDDLVFPNGEGRPDTHLIYRLHNVAKKAGLNLKGKRAGHMFRKTAGSRVAKKLGLRAAMDFLGHSDVKTTALYLAADDMDSKKSQQAFEEMFEDSD